MRDHTPSSKPFAPAAIQGNSSSMPEPSDLFAMLVFSVIGIVAFRSAKRECQPARLVISMGLMLYPYFISSGLWLWVAGIVLTGCLFVFKE